MFQGIGPIVGWFSIIIVIGLFIHMMRTPKRYWLLRTGLALIIGGALGNLVDRVTAGEVLDFIWVSFLPGIFNISDVMVNIGMFISLAAVFLQPEEKEDPIEEQETAVEDKGLSIEEEPSFNFEDETPQIEPTEQERTIPEPEPEITDSYPPLNTDN